VVSFLRKEIPEDTGTCGHLQIRRGRNHGSITANEQV
jgi:hypothetical protein